MTDNVEKMPVTYTRLLARLLDSSVGNHDHLLTGTDIRDEDIRLEGFFITTEQQYLIVENALLMDPRPGLGLRMGRTVDLSSHGVVGIAALTSATLLNVFEMLARYYMLRVPMCKSELRQTSTEIQFCIMNKVAMAEPVNRFLLEAYTSMFEAITESIIGRAAQEARIIFGFDEPDTADIYRNHFSGTVGFGNKEFTEYRFPTSLANHPCPSVDALLRRQAELGCIEMLTKALQQDSWKSKVEQILSMEDGTLLSLEEMAGLLYVSKRTLIRKLNAENTSYQQLLDMRHKELCLQYLVDGSWSIEAVAQALGYPYSSNFRRAFRRWFGTSPSEYRRRLIDEPKVVSA